MTALFLILLLSQPITDLGVMTPNRVILLEPCTNRTDFQMFKIELQALRWPSNFFSFNASNNVLTIEDFNAMPPGPCVMGVRSVHKDSDESPIELFKLDIRRDPPKPVRATVIQKIGGNSSPQSLSNAFHARRVSGPKPPLPSGVTNIVPTNEPIQFNLNHPIQPIPNGKPETYSDGVIKQQQFYAARQAQRRNQ